MTTTPKGWEGILAPGETIQWQDRPTGAVMWRDLLQFQSLLGLLFAGFAWAWLQGVRWMSGGVTRSAEGLILFEVVGALFIAVGAYMVIGRIFVEAWQRRRTWYTLTDRAAYLATDTFGKRSLKRIGLDEMNLLQLVDEEPGTIWLRQEVHVDRSLGNSPHSRRHGRGAHPPAELWLSAHPRRPRGLAADRRPARRNRP